MFVIAIQYLLIIKRICHVLGECVKYIYRKQSHFGEIIKKIEYYDLYSQ